MHTKRYDPIKIMMHSTSCTILNITNRYYHSKYTGLQIILKVELYFLEMMNDAENAASWLLLRFTLVVLVFKSIFLS